MRMLPIIAAACAAWAGCTSEAHTSSAEQAAEGVCTETPSTGDRGPDASIAHAPPTTVHATADAGDVEPAVPTKSQALSRLAGHYAHFDVVAYEDGDNHTLIITWGFTDLYLEGDALFAQESFCHAEQSTNQPATSDVPDAFTRAILPVPAPIAVRTDADGRFVLWRTETPTPIGVELDDPAHEHLPSDPKDPRIIDSDGDGKPGVTVHLHLSGALDVDLYIARREIFAYEVAEQADHSLRGRVYDHSEQLVLGSSNPLFSPSGQWLQHADLELSPIVLIPVAADMDCDQLVSQREDLFGKAPVAWK